MHSTKKTNSAKRVTFTGVKSEERDLPAGSWSPCDGSDLLHDGGQVKITIEIDQSKYSRSEEKEIVSEALASVLVAHHKSTKFEKKRTGRVYNEVNEKIGHYEIEWEKK